MTTIAMVIGMLPLALASGAGAEWKNGMTWALIGGLTSSMLLTLVVVPVILLLSITLKNTFHTHGSRTEPSSLTSWKRYLVLCQPNYDAGNTRTEDAEITEKALCAPLAPMFVFL